MSISEKYIIPTTFQKVNGEAYMETATSFKNIYTRLQ